MRKVFRLLSLSIASVSLQIKAVISLSCLEPGQSQGEVLKDAWPIARCCDSAHCSKVGNGNTSFSFQSHSHGMYDDFYIFWSIQKRHLSLLSEQSCDNSIKSQSSCFLPQLLISNTLSQKHKCFCPRVCFILLWLSQCSGSHTSAFLDSIKFLWVHEGYSKAF